MFNYSSMQKPNSVTTMPVQNPQQPPSRFLPQRPDMIDNIHPVDWRPPGFNRPVNQQPVQNNFSKFLNPYGGITQQILDMYLKGMQKQ